MQNYKLKFISGTKKFVLEELNHKHSSANITGHSKGVIEFESNESDIDAFRDLYSALSITALNASNEESVSRNLFRREWKVKSVPAGINPALAYVLCNLAELKPEDIVLDPFCGAGTIAITAGKYFEVERVLASDLSGKAIDYTVENIKASGLKNITAFRSNVSQLKLKKESVSKVITNLPFGIRVGDHETNKKAYKSFAMQMTRVLKPESKLVIYTQEKKLTLDIMRDYKFELQESFEVESSGLKPEVFLYKLGS